jgi:hypothetical protein
MRCRWCGTSKPCRCAPEVSEKAVGEITLPVWTAWPTAKDRDPNHSHKDHTRKPDKAPK